MNYLNKRRSGAYPGTLSVSANYVPVESNFYNSPAGSGYVKAKNHDCTILCDRNLRRIQL